MKKFLKRHKKKILLGLPLIGVLLQQAGSRYRKQKPK